MGTAHHQERHPEPAIDQRDLEECDKTTPRTNRPDHRECVSLEEFITQFNSVIRRNQKQASLKRTGVKQEIKNEGKVEGPTPLHLSFKRHVHPCRRRSGRSISGAKRRGSDQPPREAPQIEDDSEYSVVFRLRVGSSSTTCIVPPNDLESMVDQLQAVMEDSFEVCRVPKVRRKKTRRKRVRQPKKTSAQRRNRGGNMAGVAVDPEQASVGDGLDRLDTMPQ